MHDSPPVPDPPDSQPGDAASAASAPGHATDGAEPPADLTGLRLGKPDKAAAGIPAVLSSFKHLGRQAGLRRSWRAAADLNQRHGFDCPSCAWPDPEDHRSFAEFCENGAKAVASEATTRLADREFFARHSIADLAARSDYWLEQQGRLAHPMLREPGASHYQPVTWQRAFDLIADELNALDNPDQASFYTSGRTSNEAAFLYQLFVRQFGTNNLPDCSNMCHESSGAALKETIGVGKGTVSLQDIHHAAVLFIVGQNPGTNHPRMLSALQAAARNGARIIAVNPLREAGLLGFKHPQELRGALGLATPLATQFLQVRVNGDQALFRGLAKALLQLDDELGGVVDHRFLDEHTIGYDAWKQQVERTGWEEIERHSGLDRQQILTAARTAGEAGGRVISCWAMGLTQHHNAVATIREVTHVHLLLGALGVPGGGLCPVRGHSNVQGDRTMGIFEKMPDAFLDSLGEACGFKPPRHHGLDTVGTIKAMHEGKVKVFFALGGNFLSASPDTLFTAAALQRCRLTAHVSTKLNRSHLITGGRALILPCLGRTELDLQQGFPQFVTVENSMSVVHRSTGSLSPASNHLLSEPRIVARLAETVLGRHKDNRPPSSVRWNWLADDYDRIRDLIARVVPGFENFNRRVRADNGFRLPNAAAQRQWTTTAGKATFVPSPLTSFQAGDGQLVLQTFRSHDQFNTTIYGLHDRYRGISNERRVVFLNPDDMRARGIKPLAPVDITGHWRDQTRHAAGFLAVPYDIPAGTAAAYFPEANVLVPADSTAATSNTPTSKSVAISVAPAA